MSVVPTTPTQPIPSRLRLGDLAAADGRWTQAVSDWATTRDGPDRIEADRRIRWFLAEAARPGAIVRLDAQYRDSGLSLLMAGCGLGFLGTAIVLYGEGRDGAVQSAVSIAAWICIIAAAALAVVWARQADRSTSPLTDADVALALGLAATLDASAHREDRDPA